MGVWKKAAQNLVCMVLVCTVVYLPPTQICPPEELYLQQQEKDSCTLCASAMMIRSRLYLAGWENWQAVTESDIRSSAWTSAGLSWTWEYEIGDAFFAIGHKKTEGFSEDQLAGLLKEHPEGVVLYCGGSKPHAVLVTGCKAGVFYCADPAFCYSGKEIPLDQSLLGCRHGTQKRILNGATAYWYLSDSNVSPRVSVGDVNIRDLPDHTGKSLVFRY